MTIVVNEWPSQREGTGNWEQGIGNWELGIGNWELGMDALYLLSIDTRVFPLTPRLLPNLQLTFRQVVVDSAANKVSLPDLVH